MWRTFHSSRVRLFGLRATATSTSTNGGASSSNIRGNNTVAASYITDAPERMQAHPILFNVPVVFRAVGRDAELMSLWQNLLLGRRCQVITGLDGIGKSTVAAEFCERARRSGRFTCIHWFNARDSLRSNVVHFFQSMKGRNEKDVLLVIDDLSDPEEALRLVPEHANVYTLLTTATDLESSVKVGVVKLGPLTEAAAGHFLRVPEVMGTTPAVAEVLRAVGYVPILMHVACCLMESEVIDPLQLKKEMEAKDEFCRDVVSLSRTLRVLVAVAVRALEKQRPGSKQKLEMLSFFDVNEISHAIVDAILDGEEDENFVLQISGLGLCNQNWDTTSLSIHPSVAQILRENSGDACVAESAKVLKYLWPRRWRGAGSKVAHELMRHARAISSASEAHRIPLSDDLLLCLDRSASLLALYEGKDLSTAAELWFRVVQANREARRSSAEVVRVARECGRLLHFLRDDRAGAVLQYAFELARAVHGKQSPEAALILGCYAPYLPTSRDAVQHLREGAATLENSLSSVDAVLGKEEERMLLETIFVLLMREGQLLEELGDLVPASLWTALEVVEGRIKGGLRSAQLS